MIDDVFVSNLLAWGLQALCLTLAGAALPALLRLDAPGVRYVYWRTLLGLSIALPFLQPRHTVASVTSITASARLADPGAAAGQESGTPLSLAGPDWILIVVAILAAGAIVRIAWIAFGLVRLHRLRFAGEEAMGLEDREEVERLVGAHAELRYVPGIKQPVTFGIRPAVVLLPEMLRHQSTEVQRAVLAHELFHVQRHDWAWLLAEELVRGVLWFHPAVWWLVSRIQLTREEVVDEMTLLVAPRRSTYVQALLAFADRPPFTPVAAFARKRHLFRRIALISKEAAMSSKRLITSCAVMATIVATGGWYAIGAFPLQQSVSHMSAETSQRGVGPLEARAKPVTPENPIPRRVNHVAPIYPAEAAAEELSGTVTVRVTLAADGSVAEARATGTSFRAPHSTSEGKVVALDRRDALTVSGPGSTLVDAAVAAIRQWRYDPPFEAPLTFSVRINFGPGGKVGEGGAFVPPPPPPTPPPAPQATGGVVSHRAAPPPPPPPPAPEFEASALRVGGNIGTPRKIHDVKPVYPEEAKTQGIQGVVIVEVRIDEEGRVSDARVLRSIPELNEAALEAVRQWMFTPTLMNGKPVPLIMTVTVNFTLQ